MPVRLTSPQLAGLDWRPLARFTGPVLPPLPPFVEDDEDEPALLTRSHSLPMLPSQRRLKLVCGSAATGRVTPPSPSSPTPRASRVKRPRSIDADEDDGDRAQRLVELGDKDFRVVQRRKVGSAAAPRRTVRTRGTAQTRSA